MKTRVIKLKFAGRCQECGLALPAGTTANWSGKGRVSCVGTHTGGGEGLTNAYNAKLEAYEKRGYRTWKQRYGRCEDAPCCGCCGGYESYSSYEGNYDGE